MSDIRKAVAQIRKDHNIVERAKTDVLFRIERSMVQSLLDVPVIGLEQMRFKFVEDRDLDGSFATDGETIFYNPFAVSKMTEQQLNTALCHQTLHFVLKHLQRRQDRNVDRWDAACDEEVKVALNDEIKANSRKWFVNYHFDKNMLQTNHKTGTTAEKIYDFSLPADCDDDVHSLWDLAKMESAQLKDTAAASFDGQRVLNGDVIQIPTDLTEQFQMVEAVAQHIESKSHFTKDEVTNIVKFSYNFHTTLCVFLIKRTVCHQATLSTLLTQPEWVAWAQIYRHYIM